MEKLSLAKYNIEIHKDKGVGYWRNLYLEFIELMDFDSIIEFGSGSPSFLNKIEAKRKVALDSGDKYIKSFNESGIEFHELDFDKDIMPDLGTFDIAICSDVFEHLLYPDKTLYNIKTSLTKKGILFSHVPNEFTFKKTIQVMLGISESLYFHKNCEEYSDPHLHRFTKTGYEKFLKLHFKYNLFISDLKYNSKLKLLNFLKIPIPYTFQNGPTFISTNDLNSYNHMIDLKRKLSL
ncbi:MAG: methyltransferase domain-containing protein [Sulfurovaceae bacterium]|nr:methyltransferase domain-containing protein [Sulfurovaceae bacterium]